MVLPLQSQIAAGRRAAEFAPFCTGLDAPGAGFTERFVAPQLQNGRIMQLKIELRYTAMCRQPNSLRGWHLRLQVRISARCKIGNLHC
jgi:hypothetical protein